MSRRDKTLPSDSVRRMTAGERVPLASERPPKRRRRRHLISPLTRRILTVNMLALAIPVAGLLYLGQYRENLIQSELTALQSQARIFAGALGEGAIGTAADGTQILLPDTARPMLRRLVQPTQGRARLFDITGDMLADSRLLAGPGGDVQIEMLPPPSTTDAATSAILDGYEAITYLFPGRQRPPLYRERPVQAAADYVEVMGALNGGPVGSVRRTGDGQLVLISAVPVQRFKRVLGALMLSAGGAEIERAVREIRIDILRAFALALAVTVLMSFYLAGTIVRPVLRLAGAAERVRRRGHGTSELLPDFSYRQDEIGDLSGALRDMTDALAKRMDAIESFAADVAHEIKNPLTSLRSAVETAARVQDPEQQRRLMNIILDDVQRLNRLITDISDASRVDAELARSADDRVDLARLLETLSDVYQSTSDGKTPALDVRIDARQPLVVDGIEDRLVQVFRNLITNAFSFSPPDGRVVISGHRLAGVIEITVDDDGPGLPEGSEEKIFQRFYSERPEGEHFGEHSGLGLSISRQITEAHGGTLTAANRVGLTGTVAGARFTVRLPVAEDGGGDR